MQTQETKYPITIAGNQLVLTFDISEAPTKKGINMMFVMKNDSEDIKAKQDLQNKLSVVLQKKFGAAGIPIDFNERNPYNNVISFIVPLTALADNLVKILRNGSEPSQDSNDNSSQED
jgi:hypothetical protein